MSGQNGLPDAAWYPDPYGTSTLRWWDGARWTDAVHPPLAEPVTSPVAAPAQPVVSRLVTEPVASDPIFSEPVSAAPTSPTLAFSAPASSTPVSSGQVFSGSSVATPALNEDSLGKYDWSRESRGFDTFPGSAASASIAPRLSVPTRAAETNTASSWVIVFMPLLAIMGLVAVLLAIASVPGFRVAGLPTELLVISVAVAFYLVTVLLALVDNRRLYSNGVDRPAHWAWALLSAPIYLIARFVAVRREVEKLSLGKLIVHLLLLAGATWVVLNFETTVWPFLASLLNLG